MAGYRHVDKGNGAPYLQLSDNEYNEEVIEASKPYNARLLLPVSEISCLIAWIIAQILQ